MVVLFSVGVVKVLPVKIADVALSASYQFTVKALLMLELMVVVVPAQICVLAGVGSGAVMTCTNTCVRWEGQPFSILSTK